MVRWLTFLIILCAVGGCARAPLAKQIERTERYDEDFSGIIFREINTGEVLFARDADKLYTPASNTKLFTLATALAWLPQDSLPAIAYRAEADTLRLWALAYPDLAADTAPYNERIRQFISAWPGTVDLNLHGYVNLTRFGSGWMWDDYPYAFARERSGLPVYRNLLHVWREPSGKLASRPAFVSLRDDADGKRARVSRGETNNRYTATAIQPGDSVAAPLYAASNLALQLLEDWTGRSIRYHNKPLPADWGAQVFYGQPRDTLLRRMMLPSDNFLAEHLLLQAGIYAHDLTSESSIRARAQKDVLRLSPKQLKWADGSGISHYNLVSPRAITDVLEQLWKETDRGLLLSLFPAGGESGTISKFYGSGKTTPYVYAKTGTLRHTHCLSGYLRAKSGKWLSFSIMNNHYEGSSADYKEAMERTLITARDSY